MYTHLLFWFIIIDAYELYTPYVDIHFLWACVYAIDIIRIVVSQVKTRWNRQGEVALLDI